MRAGVIVIPDEFNAAGLMVRESPSPFDVWAEYIADGKLQRAEADQLLSRNRWRCSSAPGARLLEFVQYHQSSSTCFPFPFVSFLQISDAREGATSLALQLRCVAVLCCNEHKQATMRDWQAQSEDSTRSFAVLRLVELLSVLLQSPRSTCSCLGPMGGVGGGGMVERWACTCTAVLLPHDGNRRL